ncbi:hypothetical protein [uncultured Roseibium sp.]|uniref:lipopolysaccharide biosynthesis protein n=1 Tax=uncultured Roseibium sp. TaxID=1936171 RepID=UPI003217A2C1
MLAKIWRISRKNPRLLNLFEGIASKAIGAVMWFGFTIVISRNLDILETGYFFYALSIFLFIPQVTNAGYPPLLLRYGSEMLHMQDFRGASRLLRRSITVTIICSLLASVAFIASSRWGLTDLYTDNDLFIACFVIGSLLFSLQALFRNAEIAFDRIRDSNLNFYVFRGLFSLVFSYIALQTWRSDLVVAMLAICSAMLLIVLRDFYVLRDFIFKRRPASSATNEAIWPKPTLTWISECGSALIIKGDALFVSFFLGIEAVASYFIAQRIAVFAEFFIDGLRSYVAPRLSKAFYSGGSVTERNRTISEVAVVYFLASFVCVVPLLIAAPYLLQLFGGHAEDALLSCYILILGRLLVASFGPTIFILDYANLRIYRSYITLFFLILTPFVYWLSTSVLGFVGAATAYSFIIVVNGLVRALVSWRKLAIWPGVTPQGAINEAKGLLKMKQKGI